MFEKIISGNDIRHGSSVFSTDQLGNSEVVPVSVSLNGVHHSSVIEDRMKLYRFYSGDDDGSGGGGILQIRAISETHAKPTGTVDGDLVIIMAQASNADLTGPAGFTQLASFNTNRDYGVWWKIASSEPSTYTVTNATEYIIFSVQGCHGTPIHASEDEAPAASSSHTYSPLTLSTNGCLIIGFHFQIDNTPEAAITSGPATIQASNYQTSGFDRGMMFFTMNSLQNTGYSDDITISRDAVVGRVTQIAIKPG